MSTESIKEFEDLLNSRDYYVTANDQIAFSSGNDVINLVLGNLA